MLVNIDNEIIKLLGLKEQKIISLKKKCIKRLSQDICDVISKDI